MQYRMLGAVIITLLAAGGCSGGKYTVGDEHYTSGEYDKAVNEYEQIAETNPGDPGVFLRLGDVHFAREKYGKAANAYNRALELKPDDESILDKWKVAAARHADGLSEAGDHEAAIEIYETLDRRLPGNPEFLLPLAENYEKAGSREKAVAAYKRILRNNPEHEAAAAAAKRIEFESSETYRKYLKAQELYNNEIYYEAWQLLEKVIEEKRDFVEAHYLRYMSEGKHYLRRDSVDALWDAISAFGMANTRKPDEIEPVFRMAQAFEKKDKKELEKYDGIYEMYQKVIDQAPDSEYAELSKKKIKELKEYKKKMEKFLGIGGKGGSR